MKTPTRSTSAKVRPSSASTACMSSMHVRVSTSISPERRRVGTIGRDLPGEVHVIAVDDGVGVGAAAQGGVAIDLAHLRIVAG